MPRTVRCKRCAGHVADVGRLSARKLCYGCGEAQIMESARQLAAKSGAHYDSWREGMLTFAANLYTVPDTPAVLDPDAARLDAERETTSA